MNSSLVPFTTPQARVLALIATAGERAPLRFLEFDKTHRRYLPSETPSRRRLSRRRGSPPWPAAPRRLDRLFGRCRLTAKAELFCHRRAML
jgi:hypothetical protein